MIFPNPIDAWISSHRQFAPTDAASFLKTYWASTVLRQPAVRPAKNVAFTNDNAPGQGVFRSYDERLRTIEAGTVLTSQYVARSLDAIERSRRLLA